MDSKELARWSLLFHLLLVLGTCDVIPSDVNHAAQIQENTPMHHANSHSSSQMMHPINDPNKNLFFFVDDLKIGKTMRLFYGDDGDPNPLSSPYLWPKEKADAIPFSSAKVPEILQHFSIPKGSRKAQVVERTLKQCESEPITGETKSCTTSLESLKDFARNILGTDAKIEALSTHRVTKSKPSPRLQDYTIIEAPERIPTQKKIACHTMPYPYMVFYCHYHEGDNRLYKTSLSGEDGDRIEAVAICHMDTSDWNRDHVSFKVLGIKPGSGPVCHIFPVENFVLVPSTASSI